MKMGLQTTQKTWNAGKTICIAVPKKICAILGINAGDYVQIDWGEVIKREDLKGEDVKSRYKKKEIVKIDNKDGLEDVLPDF